MIVSTKRIVLLRVFLLLFLSLSVLLGVLLYRERRANEPNLFEEYYDMCVSEFQGENRIYRETGTEVDIVFIGDSITEGFELNKTPYEENYTVAWRGIGGDDTFGLLERMQVSVYDVSPRLVVLCIGGNNLKTMLENYEDILSGLKTNLPDTEVIVHPIYPTNHRYAERNEVIPGINEELYRLVRKYGYVYADTHSALKDAEGRLAAEHTEDGAHPNLLGYEKITEVLLPLIDEALKE